jgi:hypothetical protein
LTVFKTLLRAIVVFEDEGRGSGSKMLDYYLLVLDFLVILLALIHFDCDYLANVNDLFVIGAVKFISPAFLWTYACQFGHV